MRNSRPITTAAVLIGLGLLGHRARPVQAQTSPDPGVKRSASRSGHWSFAPPSRPALPVVKNRNWVHNPIDAFILDELEGLELAPAPEADRVTLLRRLRFDLTGL